MFLSGNYEYDRKTKKLYTIKDTNKDSAKDFIANRVESLPNCNGILNNLSYSNLNGHSQSMSRFNDITDSTDSPIPPRSSVLGHHSARRKTRHEINVELRRRFGDRNSSVQCDCSSNEHPEQAKSRCFNRLVPDCLRKTSEQTVNGHCSSRNQNGQLQMQSCESNINCVDNSLSNSMSSVGRVPCSCFSYRELSGSDGFANRATGSSSMETLAVNLSNDIDGDSHTDSKFYVGTGQTDPEEVTYF